MFDKRLIGLLPESMRWVKLTVLANWFNLLGSIAIAFVIALSVQFYPFYKLFENNELAILLGILALAIVVKVGAIILANRFSYKASRNMKLKLRQAMFEKLIDIEMHAKRQTSRVSISQIGSEGIEGLETYMGRYMPQFFYSLLAPLTLFAVLSFISFKIALVLLICVPLIPISIVAVTKIAKKILKRYMGIYLKMGDNFLDNLQGLLTAKLYRADKFKNEEVNKESEDFRRITMRVLVMQLNSISIMDILAYGGAAVGIILSVLAFRAGELEFYEALVFILLSAEFFIPLRLLGSFFHVAMTSKSAIDVIFRFLDTPVEKSNRISAEQSASVLAQPIGVEIKDLNFNYNDEKQTLKNINLSIKPKNLTVIVGESGSGKSTLAGIIAQKFKDYTGSILLNSTELNTLDLASFYKKVCLVSHSNYIFKGSLSENLRMAKADATDDELLQVLAKVNLSEFVENNGGLEMPISDKASNLSGGQIQRLALARAILLDADFYIFDEATSNIDTQSEAIFMQLINQMKAEKTILMITHRLANALSADSIWVFDQGQAVENGTHEQLVQKGVYGKLYAEQEHLENLRGGKDAQ